eukprot:6094939-Pyramimonas_sp.AAC.1
MPGAGVSVGRLRGTKVAEAARPDGSRTHEYEKQPSCRGAKMARVTTNSCTKWRQQSRTPRAQKRGTGGETF